MSNPKMEVLVAKREEYSKLIYGLADLQASFLESTTEFIRNWYLSTAESYATRNLTNTKSLGKNKIAEMKKEISALQDAASSIVTKHFNSIDLWWHINCNDFSYKIYYKELPEMLRKSMRLIGGELSVILEKYKYISNTPNSPNAWRSSATSAYNYCPFKIQCPDQVLDLLDRYDELKNRSSILKTEMKIIEDELNRREAKSIWDEA